MKCDSQVLRRYGASGYVQVSVCSNSTTTILMPITKHTTAIAGARNTDDASFMNQCLPDSSFRECACSMRYVEADKQVSICWSMVLLLLVWTFQRRPSIRLDAGGLMQQELIGRYWTPD